MSFNYRHFLRQIPKERLKNYFDPLHIDMDIANWNRDDRQIGALLAEIIKRMPSEISAPILSDFQRINALSDEKGINAIFNASDDALALGTIFRSLENNLDRAFWLLIHDLSVFKAAEEIRYFDYRAEGQYASQYLTDPDLHISDEADDIGAFERSVSEFFLKKDGSGKNCVTEVIRRYTDNSVQVTIYTEALPNNVAEFGNNGLERRTSRPVIEFVIVYRPEGIIETVVKGGRPVHEAMRERFARHM